MEMSPEAIKANMKAMSEGRSIIAVQKEGQDIPFFSLALYSMMEDLSSHLGNNQPFYCVAPPQSRQDEYILEKASIYLKEIKAIQAEGPYILSALCNMHFIVFEIAQKLLDQGEEVPVVILFEALRPIAYRPLNSFGYRIRRANDYRISIANRIYSKFRDESLTNSIKIISIIFYRELNKLNFFTKKNKSAKLIDKASTPKRNDSELIQNYKGNVVVFKASKRPIYCNNYPYLGWREYVLGDLKIITVEGDHTGIFKSPYVGKLAAKLSDVLSEYNLK